MHNLIFCLPFTYFQRTRLNSFKALLFHSYTEWLLAILILIYFGNTPTQSILNFLGGYFAFISLYEIGYLLNDVYSVRFENKPRKRIKDFNPSNAILGLWIGIRLLIFALISFYLNTWREPKWLVFYIVLAVMFFLHNYLTNKQLKTFTFFNLAFLRFFAPFFIFLSSEDLSLLVPGIILNYVFYRTLTYIDSKGLLLMPDRENISFKLNYYLLMSGVSVTAYFMTNQAEILFLTAYFIGFWLGIFLLQKIGIFKLLTN